MSFDEAQYASLIDDILRHSDLNTISAKRIRKQLADKLGYDIDEHKDAIKKLIEKRFDKIHEAAAETEAGATKSPSNAKTNGRSARASSPPSPSRSSPAKRAADDSELSDVIDSPKPKKKRAKVSADVEDDDAAYAARLQAEENSRARPTRGGATKKKPITKPKKKKSAAKVKDNSDESGSEAPKERKGGFHKPMNLSEPLADLHGETQLSRPQTVKKIWEYVKARELQDPSDKRQIRCDDAMRAVFKLDRVHMFTMNKILNQNLYAVDE